ncbi:hypothetical protein, partial [Mycobacterium tuberculosis]|uniref:hypothetical protein n=1 Tax=Mycobacterium tuberculosis TaxID=1773 RepID=UPI001BE04F03
YDPSGFYIGRYMSELMSETFASKKGYHSTRLNFDGRESILSQYQMKGYPWQLVSVTEWNTLAKETNQLVSWYVIIIIC